MIILLDGKEYAVGLNWFAVTSEEEVAQFQREMDMNFGVLKLNKKSTDQSSVALSGPEYADQVSLAGILSYAHKNLLFVTSTSVKNEAGAPLFYLCAVKNGVVSVDGDVIGDMENIQSIYQQSLAEMTGDMPLEKIERFCCGVDESAFPDLNPVKLGAVLDTAQRYASACIIKPIAKKALSMASVAMVAGAFIIGGYFMFSWVFQEPPPPPVVQHEQIVVKKDPYEVFIQGFAATLQNMPRPQVVSDFVDTVKTIPLAVQGWQLSDLNYNGAAKSISLLLVRSPYTTVNNLNEIASSTLMKSFQISSELTNASAQFPFDATLSTIPIPSIRALPATNSQINFYNFASLMQSHNIAYQASKDTSIQYFITNRFTIAGSDLWELERVGKLLEIIPTLGIQSITMKYNNGTYLWSLEGTVYG